jgi:HEAT repeat protein
VKRLICVTCLVLATPSPGHAFLDFSPTLGRVIRDAPQIVVLEVDKVSRDKQVIVFKKIANLMGNDPPGEVKHKLTDGFHPRQARTVLDWAEPGNVAICFHTDNIALTCIGSYWYQCAPSGPSGWVMATGRADLCYAYSGSAVRLRDHVTAMLDGREAVITALKFEAMVGKGLERKIDRWAAFEAVGSGRLMRGKDWPVWRLKASLHMPPTTLLLIQDGQSIVGDGAASAADVPAQARSLAHNTAHVRIEAAEDLAMIGAAAAPAVPALLRACQDGDPLVRVAAARAVACIDSKNDKVLPLLIEALKDKAGRVRRRAAECLGELGPGARSAVPALGETARDADPTVRWAAIDALGQIGPDAHKAVPTLIEALADASTRGAAVDALGQIGRKAQPAIPALERVLNGDDVAARWPAAAALVRIGGSGVKAGVRFFVEAAGRDRGKGLFDASNILVAPTAREALPDLLDAVRDPALRDLASEIIRSLTLNPYLHKDQVPDAMKFVKDPDPAVRCVAVWVLHCGQNTAGESVELKEVIWVLRQALTAADPWARRQAIRYLGLLGPVARDAAPEVSALLEDQDAGVREAAAASLKIIQPK